MPMTLEDAKTVLLDLAKDSILEDDDRDSIRVVLAALADAQNRLGSLLARIHRDGGHYEQQHGTAKAAEDAERVVLRERAALDEAQAEAERCAAELTDVLNEEHACAAAEKARADAATLDAAALREIVGDGRNERGNCRWCGFKPPRCNPDSCDMAAALARPAPAALERLRALEVLEQAVRDDCHLCVRKALAALDALKEQP